MAFKPPSPTPPGLWRRMPPAVFPSIMGLFGLGLAWRKAVYSLDVPPGIGEAILGATSLLFAFTLLAYLVKIIRRPSVVLDELRILPGRAGLAAGVLCLYLLSITLAPYAFGIAHKILLVGLGVHVLFVLLAVHQFVSGPSEQRKVTPVWHLTYVGFIIGALAATVFGLYLAALVIFLITSLIAGLIWSVSLEQGVKEEVPAPLRPLLAIHLSPVALLGLVAYELDFQAVSLGCAGIAGLVLLWFVARSRWLTAAGFSAMWGAFTFPLAATANLWLTIDVTWRYPGGIALAAATIIIPVIAFRILRLWAAGQLAIKTNAATA